MASLRDLEEQGSAEVGVSMQPAQQTTGGSTNLVITRRYKVRSSSATDYIFQILNASPRIMDPTFTDAYLIAQSIGPLDASNGILTCVFAQLPQTWDEAFYNAVTFPGVDPSSLYSPYDFAFRSGAVSFTTQARYEHTYFLGPINAIPTRTKFKVVDTDGNQVSVVTDFTEPSSDEYISYVQGRQELVIESVVLPWRGDIWDRRSLLAIAK